MRNLFSRHSALIAAIVAQALSSLTNFVFLVGLMTALSPEEFGEYSVAFAVMLAGGAVLQGFFQLQMVTQLPAYPVEERQGFASALFVIQSIVAGSLVVLVLIATRVFTDLQADALLAVATSVAILSLAGKEFLLRYLFSTENYGIKVIWINLAAAISIVALLAIGIPQNGSGEAMATYAGANLMAMFAGNLAVKLPFRKLPLRHSLFRIARKGAWASLSALIYSLRATAHTFIVGASLSVAEAGRMNAARTIVTPVTLLIPALSSVTLPRFSQAYRMGGPYAVLILSRRMATGMFVLVSVYSLLLLLAWSDLQKVVLGDSYAELGSFVAVWCVYAYSIAMRNAMEWCAQAAQAFRALSMLNVPASLGTIALVAFLSQIYGVTGAILGASIGEAIMAAVLTLIMQKKRTEG